MKLVRGLEGLDNHLTAMQICELRSSSGHGRGSVGVCKGGSCRRSVDDPANPF